MSSSSSREQMITVAKLYYIGNMTQHEIAETLGLSRPKISRLLKSARDMRIVKFSIASQPSNLVKLEEKLKAHFALKHVKVVTSDPSEDENKSTTAKACARYLESILKENSKIGLAWGSTVNSISSHLNHVHINGLSVWQLTANLAANNLNAYNQDVIKTFAEKLGASWHVINAPFIVQTELLRSLLLEEPEICEHFAAFEKLDIAIVGMGSSHPEGSSAYKANFITLEQAKALVEQGAAADICGHRLNADSSVANTFLKDKVMAIDLSTLKKIPNVIAVATGSERVASIIAACTGGYVKTLITDEIAAIALSKQLNLY